nr:MAG: putative RNA-dependent RNA polymerase [Botourmiaviridae sp.]
MYSYLRKQDWLLCGPPTDKRMTSVLVNACQTSVDLVAATDGLHLAVTELILETAFFSSVKVPRSLRALAKASFRPDVYVGSPLRGVDSYRRLGTVGHGQMMGAYLSFPLLCLHSYIAARWAARCDVGARFLVNGDDTVISASRFFDERDYPSGYRLNVRKTIRASAVAELNSTVFLRRSGKWREVRHLRRGGAVSDFEGMMHIASAVRGDAGWTNAFVRSRIGKSWGFLPSQLGLCERSYPAWKREQDLRMRRLPTALPWGGLCPPSEGLVSLGRDPLPYESEATRSYLWRMGRDGGAKRDENYPSRGKVRRSYSYRRSPPRYHRTFVCSLAARKLDSRSKKVATGWIPRDFVCVEEEEGLAQLDEWRTALCSLVCEVAC